MDELRRSLAPLMRRIARPLPAALVFCGIGLFAAVFVIAVNRVIAMRPAQQVVPVPVQAAPSSSATPSTTATPSPSANAAAACAAAPAASGAVTGLMTVTASVLTITGGDNSLSLTVPAGTRIDGSANNMHVRLPGASGQPQAVHGTLVQDATLCVGSGSNLATITVPAGESVGGNAIAGPNGLLAADLDLRAQSGEGD